jgi:hypothetical protein
VVYIMRGDEIHRPKTKQADKKFKNKPSVPEATLVSYRRATVSIEEKRRGSTTDRDAEKSAGDQLQEQIDGLVRGEVPRGPRSLRDLTQKPEPTPEIRKKDANESLHGDHPSKGGEL